MKFSVRILASAMVLGVLVSPAFAQNPQSQPQNQQQMAEALLGSFLLSHSGVANDLQSNPSLFQNSQYLGQHPELRNFLISNPQVVQMLTDPNFRTRELSHQNWRNLYQDTTGHSPGQSVGSWIDNWLGTGSSNKPQQ